MTITADAIRSGISGMSAYSRISVKNDELDKVDLKQRFVCRFNRSESRRMNQETISALKTAALNDPRYSGIRDKVETLFDGMDPKHSIRAKDVKKAFSNLDKCAFETDAGKRAFLVRDIRMRLMTGTFPDPTVKGGKSPDNAWTYSFKGELKHGCHIGDCDPELNNWALHFRKLEPLIGKMVDELAARRGGMQNITAADNRELSWKVHSILVYIGKSITDSDIGEKHHLDAFRMVANTLANSSDAMSSPLDALRIADEFHSVLNELASFEVSSGGSKFAVEDGIAWMNAMCAPLNKGKALQTFLRNHFYFDKARALELTPEQAQKLTLMVSCDFYSSNGKCDVEQELLDANSIPRQLLDFPDLANTESEYNAAALFIRMMDRENVEPEMRNPMLEALSTAARAEGRIPVNGSADAIARNGERVQFEWSLHSGTLKCIPTDHFDQVA